MKYRFFFFLLLATTIADAQTYTTASGVSEAKPDMSGPAYPSPPVVSCNSARFNEYSQRRCLQERLDWLAQNGALLCNDNAAKACIENYHRIEPEAFWCRARNNTGSTPCTGSVNFYRANWQTLGNLVDQNSGQCYNRYLVLDYDASSDVISYRAATFDSARTCYSFVLMSAIMARFPHAERIDFARGLIRYPDGCPGPVGDHPSILFRIKSGGTYYFYDLSDNPGKKKNASKSCGCEDRKPRLWNPTRILVFAVFLLGLALARKNTKEGRWLIWILSASALHEAIAITLRYHGIDNKIPANIYVFVHGLLWLLVLKRFTPFRKLQTVLIVAYISLCFLNFLFGEGISSFAYLNFVAGGIFYTAIFLVTSFQYVRENRFDFFGEPVFLLLLSPVPYFIGLGLNFGFMSKELGNLCLYNTFTFYEAVCTLVNYLYYGFVLLYLFINRKPRPEA